MTISSMSDSNKQTVYTLLKGWEAAAKDLNIVLNGDIQNEHIRTAAAILLVGGAQSDADIVKLCNILWSIWEDYQDAVQGMQ